MSCRLCFEYTSRSNERSEMSSYLILPAETRNRNYHYAFRSMVPRVLPPQGSLDVPTNESELVSLSCCRQIHYKAASLPYGLAYAVTETRRSILLDPGTSSL